MEGIMETGLPGEMVLTRRGLHLFKHKYKGTGFVNLSMDSANICSAKEKSDQPMKKLKFRTHRLKNRQPSAGGRSLPGTPQTHDICLTGPDSPISISSNFSHYDPADDYAAPASSRQRQAARSSSAKPKGTGAAPKSQRKRTTPPPQQVDDFLEDVPKSLGDWAILHCPMELSSGQKMALKTYLEWLPRRTYPFQIWDAMTHHPLRSSNPLVSLFRDDTSLQSAICMGAVSAFWSGTDTDLVKVTHYSTKLCSLINVMLGELEHQPRESILIQSVATLALLAHLRNNYAEWHIHMQGLRQLITSSKYETISDPCVRWIVHRADMNGASELVDNTYFPLVRRHQPIHEILDRGTIAETRSTIERCLGAVCSDDLTFEVFVENALLLRTVYHARSNPDVKFDPDALMEEFLWVGHLIMTTPTPYKQLHMVPEPRIYPPHELGSGPRDGSAVEVTEEEARECYQAVESALRLSILLYAKRATPDPTDAAQSHPVLLDLMDRYLRIVQAVLQHKMSIENYIDPTTLPCDSPVAKLLRTLKPALIYLCLLGDIECDLVQRKDPDSKPSRQTFRRVLELIVGPSSAHVEALDDDDLAICTIQDLSVPNRREFIPRQALKRILAGG